MFFTSTNSAILFKIGFWMFGGRLSQEGIQETWRNLTPWKFQSTNTESLKVPVDSHHLERRHWLTFISAIQANFRHNHEGMEKNGVQFYNTTSEEICWDAGSSPTRMKVDIVRCRDLNLNLHKNHEEACTLQATAITKVHLFLWPETGGVETTTSWLEVLFFFPANEGTKKVTSNLREHLLKFWPESFFLMEFPFCPKVLNSKMFYPWTNENTWGSFAASPQSWSAEDVSTDFSLSH